MYDISTLLWYLGSHSLWGESETGKSDDGWNCFEEPHFWEHRWKSPYNTQFQLKKSLSFSYFFTLCYTYRFQMKVGCQKLVIYLRKRKVRHEKAGWYFCDLSCLKRIWPSAPCTCNVHIKLVQLREGRSNLLQGLHSWAKEIPNLSTGLQLFCSLPQTSIFISKATTGLGCNQGSTLLPSPLCAWEMYLKGCCETRRLQ